MAREKKKANRKPSPLGRRRIDQWTQIAIAIAAYGERQRHAGRMTQFYATNEILRILDEFKPAVR